MVSCLNPDAKENQINATKTNDEYIRYMCLKVILPICYLEHHIIILKEISPHLCLGQNEGFSTCYTDTHKKNMFSFTKRLLRLEPKRIWAADILFWFPQSCTNAIYKSFSHVYPRYCFIFKKNDFHTLPCIFTRVKLLNYPYLLSHFFNMTGKLSHFFKINISKIL